MRPLCLKYVYLFGQKLSKLIGAGVHRKIIVLANANIDRDLLQFNLIPLTPSQERCFDGCDKY